MAPLRWRQGYFSKRIHEGNKKCPKNQATVVKLVINGFCVADEWYVLQLPCAWHTLKYLLR